MTQPDSTLIHDLWVQPLPTSRSITETRWRLPDGLAPWLRRYGEAEVIRMAAGAHLAPRVRLVADEVWALLDGEIEVDLQDGRVDSPTGGARMHLHLFEPTLVLVPFGVQSEVSSPTARSWLVRMATHTDTEDRAALPPT
ncbi:MAG: hypothetical protein WD906_04615 [Anaerolineales bacterium]